MAPQHLRNNCLYLLPLVQKATCKIQIFPGFTGHRTWQVLDEAQTKWRESLQCNFRLNKQFQKAHYWLRITMFYGIWPLKLHQFSEHYPLQCLDKSRKHYEIQAGLYQKDTSVCCKFERLDLQTHEYEASCSSIAKKRAKYPLETAYMKLESAA